MPNHTFSETDPKAETVYFDLAVGQGAPNPGETGVFFPTGYKFASEETDLILFLHGHGIKGTIFDLWGRYYAYPFAFRHYLNTTKRKAVLVAPTLGQSSEAPDLEAFRGGDKFLDEVMVGLNAAGPLKGKNPKVGNIVVACHSGGGIRMMNLVTTGFDKYENNVKECWGFDCTYNSGVGQGFHAWASGHSKAKLYIYYIAGTGTEAEAKSLESLAKQSKLKNVFVTVSSTTDHNQVPKTYFATRVNKAGLDTFGPR